MDNQHYIAIRYVGLIGENVNKINSQLVQTFLLNSNQDEEEKYDANNKFEEIVSTIQDLKKGNKTIDLNEYMFENRRDIYQFFNSLYPEHITELDIIQLLTFSEDR